MNKTKITLYCSFLLCLYQHPAYCFLGLKQPHSNKIYFSGDVHSVTFRMMDHCITHGQLFPNDIDAQTVISKHSLPGLNIKAGRHGSRHIWACIKKKLSLENESDNELSKHFTYDKIPKKLNFSVNGVLTINGVHFDKIVLAQGHYLTVNDWWFGGKNCKTNPYHDAVSCRSRDGRTWCFIRGTDYNYESTGHNIVEVTFGACP